MLWSCHFTHGVTDFYVVNGVDSKHLKGLLGKFTMRHIHQLVHGRWINRGVKEPLHCICVFPLDSLWYLRFYSYSPRGEMLEAVRHFPCGLLHRFSFWYHVLISGLMIKVGFFGGTAKLECGMKMRHGATVTLWESWGIKCKQSEDKVKGQA